MNDCGDRGDDRGDDDGAYDDDETSSRGSVPGCRVGGDISGDASSMMVRRVMRLVMWIMIGPFSNALAHALVHCHLPAHSPATGPRPPRAGPSSHHTPYTRHPGTTEGARGGRHKAARMKDAGAPGRRQRSQEVAALEAAPRFAKWRQGMGGVTPRFTKQYWSALPR